MIADNTFRLGLRIYRGKSKVFKNNAAVSTSPTILQGDGLEDETSFTYLGSIVDKQGGADADVKVRIGRARAAFLHIKNIWSSPDLTTNIKLRIFNTAATLKKIQTLINTCLRRCLRIRWLETISNREL